MGGHTPGPWAWYGNRTSLYLATVDRGREHIMSFRRRGMNDAQPYFQVGGRMFPADDLVTFEVGDKDVVGMAAAVMNSSVYRYDISGIDHPDARLIAAAPDLLETLREAVSQIEYLHEKFKPTGTGEAVIARSRIAIAKAEGRE